MPDFEPATWDERTARERMLARELGARRAEVPGDARVAPRARMVDRWLAGIVGAALALLVPVGASLADLMEERAVTSVVEAYADAVEAGDAATANDMALPDADAASVELLVDEAMPTVAVDLVSVAITGGEAVVTLAVSNTAVADIATVRLVRDDGQWTIATGLAVRMGIAPSGLVASIDGLPVPVGASAVWVYPGRHTVTPVANGDVIVVGTDAVATPGEGPQWFGVDVRPSEVLEAAIDAAAVDVVQDCADDDTGACPGLDVGADATIVATAQATHGAVSTSDPALLRVDVAVTADDGVETVGLVIAVTLVLTGGEVVELAAWLAPS